MLIFVTFLLLHRHHVIIRSISYTDQINVQKFSFQYNISTFYQCGSYVLPFVIWKFLWKSQFLLLCHPKGWTKVSPPNPERLMENTFLGVGNCLYDLKVICPNTYTLLFVHVFGYFVFVGFSTSAPSILGLFQFTLLIARAFCFNCFNLPY